MRTSRAMSKRIDMGPTQGIGCLGLPKAEEAGDLAAIDRSCAFRVGCILEARVCEPRGDACTKTCRFLERSPFASTCGGRFETALSLPSALQTD